MSFSQLISIVLARKWIALWVLAITVLVTAVVSILLPKTYTATVSLLINAKGSDPVTGYSMPSSLMPGYMATQEAIIQSRNVSLKVVDKLGIVNNPVAKKQFESATKGEGDIRDWFADSLLSNLSVQPARQTNLVEISYQGADPKFAATLANAYAEAYINTNLQIKTEPAKQASVYFDQQIKTLRQNIEKAQERLSEYQKEHEIAFADERLDTESARLAELSSQLVQAQAQTYDSSSRESQLRKGVADESPEILANGLIQNLKSQLAQSQARLNDVGQRLGRNHPQYLSAEADVNNLRRLIEVETAKTSQSVGQTARVSMQRESEIEAALAQQKERVLKLKNEHDEISVLMREVEGAQRVYDVAMQRLGQTNLEGQSSQTDVVILNPATPPLKPSGPKLTRNVILSFILGGILAIISSLVLEMIDRRVRCAEDLQKTLGLTVLAELTNSSSRWSEFVRVIKQKLNMQKSKRNFSELQTLSK